MRRLSISAIAAFVSGFIMMSSLCSCGDNQVTTISPTVSSSPSPSGSAYDVVVYGATVAGIAAAAEAAKEGMTVLLLEPSGHFGGITTGGLSSPDLFGNAKLVGGYARSFYEAMGSLYGSSSLSYNPSGAESYLHSLLSDQSITVALNSPISNAKVVNGVIEEVDTLAGMSYRGSVFIDATYEGDLMGSAGVSFTVGREPNNQYGETMNGVRISDQPYGLAIDPYIIPGAPSSGLIARIDADSTTPIGEGDGHIQAYNYRLCLSNSSQDRIPFIQPASYQSSDYEYLKRVIAEFPKIMNREMNINDIFIISKTVGSRYDFNSGYQFSTDIVHETSSYPYLDIAGRRKIQIQATAYTQGLLWFIAHDSNVPASLRNAMNTFGYCTGEFTENGGFPTQFYVREARRMLGKYVMTEANLLLRATVTDSIGRGYYPSDSHNVRIFIDHGTIVTEGHFYQSVAGPYPVSYRAIIPRNGEVKNLLVPVCLSASHVAYSSLRMEPNFMVFGQAAGAAASIAIKKHLTVQSISYTDLRTLLLKDGALL